MDEKQIARHLEEIPSAQLPEVLKLAAELHAQDRAAVERAQERRELLKAAAEAGLPPEYLERAAARLQAEQALPPLERGRRRRRMRMPRVLIAAALFIALRAAGHTMFSRPAPVLSPVASAGVSLGPCAEVDLRSVMTNQFSDSMLATPGNNLIELVDDPGADGRSGSHERQFEGVPFRLDGLVMVGPGETSGGSGERVAVRREVDGIPINRMARRLHFLQGTHWHPREGTLIGAYIVHYVDGARTVIPIRYGQDVADWWTVDDGSSEAAQNHIAWVGGNGATDLPIRLFLKSWENPRPDVPIRSLDMVTGSQAPGRDAPAPFLAGLTVEKPGAAPN